jgi:hypothetical protein
MRVIKLARLASSEGVIFKGGADHRATEFVARSCFYFTSILMPHDAHPGPQPHGDPRAAADPAKGARADARPGAIVELGKQLRRRVIDQWDRYDATLAAYRRALAGTGHKGRSADQFGTLLAFADLLLYDGPEPEPEVLADWAEALRDRTSPRPPTIAATPRRPANSWRGPCCSCAAATNPSP